MKRRNTRPPDSICWDCKNARAHLCAWIGKKKRIWSRGKAEKRSLPPSSQTESKKYVMVYIVHKCPYFQPEGKKEAVR